MIVSVTNPARPYADLSDVTTKQLLSRGWAEHDGVETYDVQYAVNLTAAEQDQVVRRLTTSGQVEETLQARAVDAYQDLLAYENAASPTNLQTVVVVKLLCKVVRAMMRVLFRRLDALD